MGYSLSSGESGDTVLNLFRSVGVNLPCKKPGCECPFVSSFSEDGSVFQVHRPCVAANGPQDCAHYSPTVSMDMCTKARSAAESLSWPVHICLWHHKKAYLEVKKLSNFLFLSRH